MTSQGQTLSPEQTELVAVGASVGAGCQPCLSHHLTVGMQAGLGGEQLLAAVASAERVSAEAAVAIGDHARVKLGASVNSPALLSRLEEALASLGAAVGTNDAANIERQLRAAADLGAARSQLQKAIDTAHSVQESAARIHLRAAERLLDALASPAATSTPDADHDAGCGCGVDDEMQDASVAADEGAGCGCGADDETQKASVTAEEPVAATSAHAAAGMAGCFDVFERFMQRPDRSVSPESEART